MAGGKFAAAATAGHAPLVGRTGPLATLIEYLRQDPNPLAHWPWPVSSACSAPGFPTCVSRSSAKWPNRTIEDFAGMMQQLI